MPCACGGQVTADDVNPYQGVAAHNRTLAHRLWANDRLVGPAVCQLCSAKVWLHTDLRRWRDADGERHRCRVVAL